MFQKLIHLIKLFDFNYCLYLDREKVNFVLIWYVNSDIHFGSTRCLPPYKNKKMSTFALRGLKRSFLSRSFSFTQYRLIRNTIKDILKCKQSDATVNATVI